MAPATKPLAVNPHVAKTTKRVASVTPHLVFVSKTCVNVLLDFAVESGKIVGERVASATSSGDTDPNKPKSATREAAFAFGRSAVTGAVNVYGALEDAGEALINAIGKETVETVSHKYGEEAADLALDATHATGDLLNTARTVKGVYGGKKLATKLGKKAAKEKTQ